MQISKQEFRLGFSYVGFGFGFHENVIAKSYRIKALHELAMHVYYTCCTL